MWTPDINSWRTFDALELRSDNDLGTLERRIREEMRFKETPAMIEKLRMVLNEKKGREAKRNGTSPKQLKVRAVLALENISRQLEGAGLASRNKRLEEISEAIRDLREDDK